MATINILSMFGLLQNLPSAISAGKDLFSQGLAGLTPDRIKRDFAVLEPFLSEIGQQISPNAPAEVHAVIGAISALAGREWIKGLQNAINAVMVGTPGFKPLNPDGKFGPLSGTALTLAQAKLGLPVDGWFGTITAKAIGYLTNPTSLDLLSLFSKAPAPKTA